MLDPRFQSSVSPAHWARLLSAHPPRRFETKDGPAILTQPCRLSFVHLDKPQIQTNAEGVSKSRFSVSMLFMDPSMAVTAPRNQGLLGIIHEETGRAFPGVSPEHLVTFDNKQSGLRDQAFAVLFADGGKRVPTKDNSKSYAGYVPGYLTIAAKSPSPVSCYVLRGGAPAERLDAAGIVREMYAGCIAVVGMRVLRSPDKKQPGMFYALQNVVKICEDVPLDKGASAAINAALDDAVMGMTAIEDPNAALSAHVATSSSSNTGW